MLRFQASDRKPCVKESAAFARVVERYRDRDVVIVAIHVQDTLSDVRQFMKANNATYPIAVDPRLNLGNRYGFKGSPYTVVIDRKGEIVQRLAGEGVPNRLPKLLDGLLKTPDLVASRPVRGALCRRGWAARRSSARRSETFHVAVTCAWRGHASGARRGTSADDPRRLDPGTERIDHRARSIRSGRGWIRKPPRSRDRCRRSRVRHGSRRRHRDAARCQWSADRRAQARASGGYRSRLAGPDPRRGGARWSRGEARRRRPHADRSRRQAAALAGK